MSDAITAVLFDLDDTLFDHSASVLYALELLRQEEPSLQRKTLLEITAEHRRLLEVMHVEVLAGRLTQDQARIDRMRGIFRFCGEDVREDVAVRAAVLHRERYRRFQQAVPGVVTLLERIRGRAKIGIVTNNLSEEQRAKLDTCGLTSFIDVMVTSEECGYAKPASEIFQMALHRLECDAGESVMIGDSWETDICGARNAGIRPLWFNRNGSAQPAVQPVEQITSFDPVEPALRLIFRSTHPDR